MRNENTIFIGRVIIHLLFGVQGAKSFKEVAVNTCHSARSVEIKRWGLFKRVVKFSLTQFPVTESCTSLSLRIVGLTEDW